MKKDFKKHEWITPNRMKFESDYRTFDRQVDYISSGNVISNVQHSSIIRPYSDTNGGVCKPGAGRKFDIDNMSHTRRIPSHIREWLDAHPEEKVWLYDFHLRNTNRKTGDSVCWILTDYDHTKVITGSIGWRWSAKRDAVMSEVTKYVVKGNWN